MMVIGEDHTVYECIFKKMFIAIINSVFLRVWLTLVLECLCYECLVSRFFV